MGRTVLLLLDLQQGIFDRFHIEPDYVQRVNDARSAAKQADVQTIYVTTSFQSGIPEVSSRNKMISLVGFVEENDKVAVPADVARIEGENIVVTKRRVSAFTGGDLEVVLRSLEADSLVLAGITTSGAVLSTLRQAADLDYRITVLEDLCLDPDPDIHRVLVNKVLTSHADVVLSQ